MSTPAPAGPADGRVGARDALDTDGAVPQWTRPAPSARSLRRDVLGCAVGAVAGVASLELYRSVGSFGGDADTVALAEQVAWVLALLAPLAVRRRYPLTVMVVCGAVFFVSGVRSPVVTATFSHQIGLFVAIYTAGAWARDRRRLQWLRAGLLVVMFAWIVQLVLTTTETPAGGPGALDPLVAAAVLTLAVNVLYFGGAWWVGDLEWQAARRRAELRQQAHRLREQAAEIARRAVTDERLRIARELHDVVAHHVSVTGVQAAAARRVMDRDPDAARAALAVVESSSRQSVAEMRQLLGALRTAAEDADSRDAAASAVPAASGRDPQPGLDALEDLVRQARAQGLSVALRRVGVMPPVPAVLGLSAYRCVQEALANVRRHSTAGAARVVVRHVDAPRPALEVEVTDDGAPRGATAGSGLGHVGMRERAALHGGEVEIGPRPGGGYRVRVRYPLPAPDGTAASERPATGAAPAPEYRP